MNNREACIILNMISGIGYAKYKALTEFFHEPQMIFSASKSELLSVRGIGENLAEKILNYAELVDYEAEMELAERSGVRILTLIDRDYPASLLGIYDPPLCLYIRGVLPDFSQRTVAIVGSRRMSTYGERMTRSFAEGAVMNNFIVVSGLAYGVDYVAHKTVVDADGITVGVLGGGLARIHPQEHVPLAREIIRKGGALISEFPMNFPVSRTSFPRRNRIVSGLSQAVIVVEAGLDSGALITANVALEQGKDIFAVPGNADNPQAKGCHKLIRDGQASLVEDFGQFMQVMDCGLFTLGELGEPASEYSTTDLNSDEELVIKALESGGSQFDPLVLSTGLEPGKLLGILMRLEMKMLILKNPDKSYRIR